MSAGHHRHLARCDRCRAEVDELRRLKARLSGLAVPPPPDELTARLLRLGGQPYERETRPVLPVPPAGPVRPPGRVASSTGPGRAGSGRSARRRATTSSAFALLGVAAALALGTPPSRPATTPVDPASEAFVTEFVGTTADGAPGPVAAVPAGRTSLTTFVPVTRAALLTTGGARTAR